MRHQNFYISNYDWTIDVFYDTNEKDADTVLECLKSIGCKGSTLERATDNLYAGKRNTGLTFSKNRKSCIVLSKTTDKENFANTLIHEIFHCSTHIAMEYDIDVFSEEPAYIAGDLGSVVLPYASKFLCDCCKTKKYRSYEKR